jgi:CHAT domain-containing protein
MLPAVEIEGRRIKEQFRRSTLYLDDEADQWKLREELQKSDGFVHIATHASRSSENPLFSRILMSDGPFFPFDLFGVDVSARLVTLSGCQTAAPGLYYGNSFSLAKAFYQAGARDVLASLWPVSDKVSMIFMAAFYRELRQTDDVATAYRTAVGEVRDLTNNPAFWGSFVLLGM